MLRKIANIIQSQIAIIVLVVAVVALLVPSSFSWIKPSSIVWLLGIIMCGMGINLKLSDFKVVFSRPKDVVMGCIAQFTIMPLLAWLLTLAFNLPADLAIGVILVGCCPGGTSSNVITYLAKGDLALSVGMTAVSTVLAPIMTPFLTYLIADKSVDVDVWGMLLSIVYVVIIPIIIGIAISHYAPKVKESVSAYLPAIAAIAIAAIVGCIFASTSEQLLKTGAVIILVVILHNLCGYGLGFIIGYIFHLDRKKLIAISVEVGMQNSGLATSLAKTHFAACPMAAVPGAIFSVWHNFSGALLAAFLNRINRNRESSSE